MVRFFAEFLKWWLTEIGDLLHVDLLKISPNATILNIDRESASLSIRKRGKVTTLGTVLLNENTSNIVTQTLQTESGRPDFNIISIPAHCGIKRHLSMPTAARRNLDELLSYELERETPFTSDEVYWGYTIARRGTVNQFLQVELVVIPKEAVDHFRETARQLGLEPNGVEIQFDGSDPLFIPFRERRRVRRLGPRRTSRQSIAITACLALLAIYLPFFFQQQKIAAVEKEIALLNIDAGTAMTIRKSMDGFKKTSDFLTHERQHTGSAIEALAATSRLIPTDSYLVAFSLREGHLTFSGLSPSAAKLIALFAQSPFFREPAFVSPVVLSEGASLETFTMTVTPYIGSWR